MSDADSTFPPRSFTIPLDNLPTFSPDSNTSTQGIPVLQSFGILASRTLPSAMSDSLPTRRSSRVASRAARAANCTAAAPPLCPTEVEAGQSSRRGNKRVASRARAPQSRTKKPRMTPRKSPPVATEDAEDEKKPAASSCSICLSESEKDEISTIDGCVHKFCFSCIDRWSERENTCPLCKTRFTKISRLHPKRQKGFQNSKKVKQRDQRSDFVTSAALESLLNSFSGGGLSAATSNRLTRFLLARMSATGGFVAIPSRTPVHPLRFDPMLDSDDSDDDEDEPVMRGFFSASPASMGFAFGPPLGHASIHSYVPRSFAVNSMDANAGRAPENPLEINDDSDDDNDIEVIQVTRSA